MADKIKITRNVFVEGEAFQPEQELTVGKEVDKKTAGYLLRIGKAVPAGPQEKAGPAKGKK